MVAAFDITLADCLDAGRGLASLAPNSVDALVTDPPAGIGFMGKGWDSDKGSRAAWVAWMTAVMRECLRTLKPGAHALVWALPRTSHWTATAIEDAGFDVRDVITHHFGSGFPKSLDVSKAIDKAAGATRAEVGPPRRQASRRSDRGGELVGGKEIEEGRWRPDTAAATAAAKQWAGWGTALKPGSEHWILARKPLVGTVAANVLEYSTGALHIDAGRINPGEEVRGGGNGKGHNGGRFGAGETSGARPIVEAHALGRWPANVILSHSATCEDGPCADDCPVRQLDEQSGELAPGGNLSGAEPSAKTGSVYGDFKARREWVSHGGRGGASRFFYCAKPSTAEREAGLLQVPGTQRANVHPTVKSIALMEYLVKLITPPRGTVLDPFAGSGTTGIAAFRLGHCFIGWEKDADYHAIAMARIDAARGAQLGLFGDAAAAALAAGGTP